jgi:hypothetical protein
LLQLMEHVLEKCFSIRLLCFPRAARIVRK